MKHEEAQLTCAKDSKMHHFSSSLPLLYLKCFVVAQSSRTQPCSTNQSAMYRSSKLCQSELTRIYPLLFSNDNRYYGAKVWFKGMKYICLRIQQEFGETGIRRHGNTLFPPGSATQAEARPGCKVGRSWEVRTKGTVTV